MCAFLIFVRLSLSAYHLESALEYVAVSCRKCHVSTWNRNFTDCGSMSEGISVEHGGVAISSILCIRVVRNFPQFGHVSTPYMFKIGHGRCSATKTKLF